MILKLKRTPGLYLVGFMASGKTTIGRAVAEEIGWPFFDVDTAIEQRAGKTIAQIFEEQGEDLFRSLETEAIRERVMRIEAGHPCVVALGGGAFVQPRNWELVANNGVTVWLDCTIERAAERLAGDTSRPLAANRDRLAQLFEARRPLYARADFRIEVDCDDVAQITRKVLELPIF